MLILMDDADMTYGTDAKNWNEGEEFCQTSATKPAEFTADVIYMSTKPPKMAWFDNC
jgi:hypothetical protein